MKTTMLFPLGVAALLLAASCKDSPSPTEPQKPATRDTTKTWGFRIVEFMPNPYDRYEDQAEWFLIRNTGDTAASLAGWKIRDNENTTWDLDPGGVLAAGAEFKLTSPLQARLNNNGDTLALFSRYGDTVQIVMYTDSEDNVPIKL